MQEEFSLHSFLVLLLEQDNVGSAVGFLVRGVGLDVFLECGVGDFVFLEFGEFVGGVGGTGL